jgi:hypothetical protein
VRIGNIRHVGPGQKGPDLMCLLGCERDEVASAKKTPKLRLKMRTAHLRHYRSRSGRNHTQLKPHAMIGPDLAVVALGGDEGSRVVDHTHADRA